jgi:site-specific recombinase XerD
MRFLNELSTYKLLSVVPLRSPFGARDHALIRFGLHTGLRVSELVGLNVGHVWGPDGPREWLDLPHQIAKGNRSRCIPLSAGARRAIRDLVAFLRMRGFQSEPDSPLFQDRRHRRLPVREVQRLMQKYREAAGLDIKATPHTLRHSWCSQMARNHSLRVVQQLAGHRFLTSTEVYLHNQPADLVAAVQSLPDF